jgi:hypothetical protein
MMKQYRILKKFETPSFTINEGVIKSVDAWKDIFRDLSSDDFDIKTDWFEPVKYTHDKRHPMCEDQPAQIDCRVGSCFHHKAGTTCLNVSPAITLNPDGSYSCWSYQHTD